MKNNYVLIDYENVQPADLSPLNKEQFHVLVFVGANQAKVSFDIVETLQRFGERAKYIKINGNGSNALDFHIAFYIGEISAKENEPYFHVISKDTGFDPLIKHLRTRGVLAYRYKSIEEIPPVKALLPKKDKNNYTELVIKDLKKRGQSKPATVSKLINSINSLFQKKLSEEEIKQTIKQLEDQGKLTITENKVSYSI